MDERCLPTAGEVESKAKAVGMSIAELCRKANIAPTTFTRWKNGSTSPTLAVCQRLLDALKQDAPRAPHSTRESEAA